MPATVNVNFLTVVHRDSGGVSTIFPDVCKTPSPGGPLPIPYPNIAMSKDTAAGSDSVTMDGNPIMLKSSYYALSTGDEAGVALGVVSNRIQGKAYPKLYSFDVKVDGENVFRLTDIMLQNGGSPTNTPPGTNIQPPSPPPAPDPGASKDPEIPEVTKMKWDKDKAACGDVVTLEVETKNFTGKEIAVNALRGKPPNNKNHEMNAWLRVLVSGNKGTFRWPSRRGRYEKVVKLTGEQKMVKGVTLTSNELEIITAPDAKQAVNFSRQTPQYTQQVVAGVKAWVKSTVKYGWNVAYDIELKSGKFTITRRIDFKNVGGASASGKQKKRWKRSIEQIWDKKFKIHRKSCYRGDSCDCYAEQGCCSYAIRVVCEWGPGQGQQVELHEGANKPGGWGTPLWWYSHTWWEEIAGVPAEVRAHEFGHQIGMFDEYPAGACDPGRLYTNDPTSIMNAGSTTFERHFKEFHDWFKQKAGGALGDTKLLRM